MYCEKLFESLEKRLEKKQSIEQIASELCPSVAKPREKIIQLIKSFKGGKYLVDNAEWLGYHTENIRTGILATRNARRLTKPTMNTRMPTQEEYGKWIDLMGSVCDNIQTVYDEIKGTTEERVLIKLRRLGKSSSQMKEMFERNKERSEKTDSLKEIAKLNSSVAETE